MEADGYIRITGRVPDPRLGKQAYAFIQLKAGRDLTLDDMRTFLREKRISPSFMPERLVLVDDMSVTPSGKFQKFTLEGHIRFGPAESPVKVVW